MRTRRGLLMFALFGAALTVAAVGWTARGDGRAKAAKSEHGTDRDYFVVHEWGTFTSFSGSDAVKLEFRPLVDADLPPFVLDRGRQEGVPNPLIKSNYKVFQRMETPVTYFYSSREREAHVSVGFPEGLLTEFYPPVDRQLPAFKWFGQPPLKGGMLDWGKIWIVPEEQLKVDAVNPQLASQLRSRLLEEILPPAGEHDHYAYARETDSALVYAERQATKKRPLAPYGAFFEKFLFYRGIGNFELPLQLSAREGGRFELTSAAAEPIRSLFLVTVEGESVRFASFDQIQPGERLTLRQSEKESSIDDLKEAVVAALVEEDLYEKEARAMVKTWQSSWFGEDGSRLFYILPRSVTDELLPLKIEPAPDETVRVMVGRLEIMRPEDEARVMSLVQQSARDRTAAEQRRAENRDAPPYELPESIIRLGRLAEPALVRIRNIAPDEQTRGEANVLLEQLRRYRDGLAAISPVTFGGEFSGAEKAPSP